jgi:uncharacterized OB-fold protein
MPTTVKTTPHEIDQDWVPVQPGLFTYPLKKGQDPSLLGNRCSKCGKTFFPKRKLCPYCYNQGDMKNVTLERQGIIYACTLVHTDSPAGIKAPYAYGYVELPTNRLRVFALFTGSDPALFNPGQRVELVLEPSGTDKEGKKIIGYKFKLI